MSIIYIIGYESIRKSESTIVKDTSEGNLTSVSSDSAGSRTISPPPDAVSPTR